MSGSWARRGLWVTVLGALLVGGCGGGGEQTGAQGAAGGESSEPIVIGAAIGRTGVNEFYDGPMSRGAEVAIAQINRRGGVNGRPLKMIYADTKSKIEEAATAASRVIEQGADMVMTTCDYDYGAPAARFANARGLVAIGCAGSTLYGVRGIGPLTFNTFQGTPTEAAAMAQLTRELGFGRPYLLQDVATQYSKTMCETFEQIWRGGGGAIAGRDTFKQGDASLAGQVTRLQSQQRNADAVVLCSFPPTGASAVKQLRDGGVDVPIVSGVAFDGDYWLEGLSDLDDFYNVSIGSIHGDDPSPQRRRFLEDYERLHGEEPPSALYPILGYSAVETLARGIEKAGSTEGEKLRRAIETFRDEPLLAGPTTYTADCHIPLGREMIALRTENGKGAYSDITVQPDRLPPSPC